MLIATSVYLIRPYRAYLDIKISLKKIKLKKLNTYLVMKLNIFLLLAFSVISPSNLSELSAEDLSFEEDSVEIFGNNEEPVMNIMADILHLRLENLVESEIMDQIPAYTETTLPINSYMIEVLDELRRARKHES